MTNESDQPGNKRREEDLVDWKIPERDGTAFYLPFKVHFFFYLAKSLKGDLLQSVSVFFFLRHSCSFLDYYRVLNLFLYYQTSISLTILASFSFNSQTFACVL